jgi:hypothetical protein
MSQDVSSELFSINNIPADIIEDMKQKKIWQATCPVSLEQLKMLKLSYIDFTGATKHDGKMIVHEAVAERTIIIFKKLFQLKFPINKIKLINDYNGDDELSMQDNNSSAFMCREITGGGRASLHSYGVAIDINPVQNPYLKPNQHSVTLLPIEGKDYLNRINIRPGMVEPIAEIFIQQGFIWGGTWNDPVDWMHFQLPREEAEKLSKVCG